MNCTLNYKGREFTADQFAEYLHSGHLDELIVNGEVSTEKLVVPIGKTDMPMDVYTNSAKLVDEEKARGAEDVEAIKTGLKQVQRSDWYKGLDEAKQKEVDGDYLSGAEKFFQAEIKRKKAVKDTSPKVITTEKKGLIKQIKDVARGAKEGAKATKLSIKETIKAGLEKLGGKLSPAQTRSIVNKATSTNFDSASSVQKLEDHIDKVVSNVNYAETVRQVKEDSSKLSKSVSGKKVPFEIKALAKRLLNIDADSVSDIEELHKAIKDLYASVSVQENKGSIYSIKEAVVKLEEESIAQKEKDLEASRKEAYDLAGGKESGMSFKEFESMLTYDEATKSEDTGESKEKGSSKRRTLLETITTSRLKDLKRYLKDVPFFMEVKGEELTRLQKTIIKSLEKIGDSFDGSKLSNAQLVSLNNIIDNMILNNSISGAGEISAIINGTIKAKEVKGMLDKFKLSWTAKVVGSFVAPANAVFRAISGGQQKGAEIYAKIFGDYNHGAKIAESKASDAMQSIRDLYEKLPDKVGGNFRIGQLAWLVQAPSEMTLKEKQAYFEAKKKKIKDSIDHLATRKDKNMSSYGERMQESYDKIKDIETIDELEEGMNNGTLLSKQEKAIWDKAKSIYESNKNDYKDIKEAYDNSPFVEESNYTGTHMFNTEEQSKEAIEDFSAPVKPQAKLSGGTKARSNVENMGESIVPNFDFHGVTTGRVRDMFMDIHSLPAKKELKNLLSSKDFKSMFSNIGGKMYAPLMERFADQINSNTSYINSSMDNLAPYKNAALSAFRNIKFAVLGGVTQAVKQPLVLLHTAAMTGTKNVVKAKAIFAKANLSKLTTNNESFNALQKVLEGSDTLGRTSMSDMAFEKSISGFTSGAGNEAIRKLGKAKNFTNRWSGGEMLQASDKMAARVSYVAFVADQLIKEGKITSNWTLEDLANNMSPEVVAKADALSAQVNGESDMSKNAILFRSSKKNALLTYVKEGLLAYKSFSTNAAVNLAVNTNLMFTSKDGKADAARSVAGFMLETFSFTAMTLLLRELKNEIAEEMFNVKDEEDDDKEDKDGVKHTASEKFATKVVLGTMYNTAASLDPGGFLTDTYVKGKFNDAYKNIIPEDKQKLLYDKQNDFSGTYGVVSDVAGSVYHPIAASIKDPLDQESDEFREMSNAQQKKAIADGTITEADKYATLSAAASIIGLGGFKEALDVAAKGARAKQKAVETEKKGHGHQKPGKPKRIQ